ncbi:hypothetical protein Tco_1119164 [Tanacetum coccineum]
MRLMSFKVKQTSVVLKVVDTWNLKWDSMYLRADKRMNKTDYAMEIPCTLEFYCACWGNTELCKMKLIGPPNALSWEVRLGLSKGECSLASDAYPFVFDHSVRVYLLFGSEINRDRVVLSDVQFALVSEIPCILFFVFVSEYFKGVGNVYCLSVLL